ncbi:hypothetical protein AGOR_G00093950 [Albula goreensis]|uniref:Linker for activation of T-cells family member 1 n=1 Tax=Albula goreensis TaxID=1534307 RepID=A0A8T3DJY4_9TELE|nr:hypothetical protein AGOR_G00093950 [Albula goreensis]
MTEVSDEKVFEKRSPCGRVMEMTVLDSMWMGALVLVPMAVLAGLCLSCRKHSHTSIQQNYGDYDETQPFPTGSGGFRIVRTTGAVLPVSTNHVSMSGGSVHSSHLLPTTSPILLPSRHSSFAPTENESIPSYENQEPGVYDKEDEDMPGYIEVLPDPPASEPINTSQYSIPSMQSSGADEVDYVNVDSGSEKSYINVRDQIPSLPLTPGFSCDSMESEDNGSSEYVNAPPQRGH